MGASSGPGSRPSDGAAVSAASPPIGFDPSRKVVDNTPEATAAVRQVLGLDPHPLAAYAERRPPRTEAERAEIAEQMAAHLPKPTNRGAISEADINAMKAAFIRRFDEDLPRTETLFAVATIGYRLALRDSDRSGEAIETPKSGSTEGESAGPKDIAQTPHPSTLKDRGR